MKTKEQTIEEYTRLLSPCELAALLIEAQTTSDQAIDALKTAYTLAEALQNQPHEFQR